jgi:hypothetical protein
MKSLSAQLLKFTMRQLMLLRTASAYQLAASPWAAIRIKAPRRGACGASVAKLRSVKSSGDVGNSFGCSCLVSAAIRRD